MLAGLLHTSNDISLSESNDEDVAEVKKSPDNDDVKLAALKKAKSEKKETQGQV
jgi:hypothetical protein